MNWWRILFLFRDPDSHSLTRYLKASLYSPSASEGPTIVARTEGTENSLNGWVGVRYGDSDLLRTGKASYNSEFIGQSEARSLILRHHQLFGPRDFGTRRLPLRSRNIRRRLFLRLLLSLSLPQPRRRTRCQMEWTQRCSETPAVREVRGRPEETGTMCPRLLK